MQLTDLPDGITVINDAYNANPDSMRAALRALATIGRGRAGARTWAVLGPMAELGPATAAAHDEIGRLVVRLGIDHLIAVAGAGRNSPTLPACCTWVPIWKARGAASPCWSPTSTRALAQLRAGLAPGDVVLVKASRSAGLERVALALIDERSAG